MLNASAICVGDKNAHTITFEIPAKIGDINLENLPVYVKTENAFGGVSKSVLKSVKSGDNLLIDWLLGAEVTIVSGVLKCQIVFEDANGELVLNTHVFELEISSSVKENGVKASAEYNHVTQLQNELVNMLNTKVVKAGDNISLFNNDACFATKEETAEYFTQEGLLPPQANAQNAGKFLAVNEQGKWCFSDIPHAVVTIDASQILSENSMLLTDEQAKLLDEYDAIKLDYSLLTGEDMAVWVFANGIQQGVKFFSPMPSINGDGELVITAYLYDYASKIVSMQNYNTPAVIGNIYSTNYETLNTLRVGSKYYSILPVVTSEDKGKFLTVNASGKWEATAIPSAEDTNF